MAGMSTETITLTGAQIIIETLKKLGVDTILVIREGLY